MLYFCKFYSQNLIVQYVLLRELNASSAKSCICYLRNAYIKNLKLKLNNNFDTILVQFGFIET